MTFLLNMSLYDWWKLVVFRLSWPHHIHYNTCNLLHITFFTEHREMMLICDNDNVDVQTKVSLGIRGVYIYICMYVHMYYV